MADGILPHMEICGFKRTKHSQPCSKPIGPAGWCGAKGHPRRVGGADSSDHADARQAAAESLMANAAAISNDEVREADLRRRQARLDALEQVGQHGSGPGEGSVAHVTPPDPHRPSLDSLIESAISDGDSADTRAEIEERVRWWDQGIGTSHGITADTAPKIAEAVRADEALRELQDRRIRGEIYAEPEWLEPDQPTQYQVTRLRTEAEMDEWREQVAGRLPESMRLSFSVIEGEVEAVAESHLGRVCCGNRITFDRTWCPDCGVTYSPAVLAEHKSELGHVSKAGGVHPFRYSGTSLCYVGGGDDNATRMADPESFVDLARDTLEARIAHETADAALGAAIDLDRLDAVLHHGALATDELQGSIDFGIAEPCNTFTHRMVLSTEPEDEDNTAAKDMSYGDAVVIEAQVFAVKPDGNTEWVTAGRVDTEWSSGLSSLCA